MKTHKETIDEYNLSPNICKYCRKPIFAKYEDKICNIKRKMFCNSSCSVSYSNSTSYKRPKSQKYYCINCGKELYTGKKYCSTHCQNEYKYHDFIKKWKNNEVKADGKETTTWKSISRYIRRYLFEKYDNKCSQCGWSKMNPTSNTIPLEIEHIDGNANNNDENNLTLLCPNCHSLTSTYKALNKGNGMRKRTWIPK